MNKGALDTFALVINFLTLDWESKHVAIGLFKAKDTIGINLASQLQVLFEKYNLINKIICCVKDEGTNLSTMTNVLKQIVNYERLGKLAPCEGVCFGHALSKTCQYATSNEKVSSGLQPGSIKFV
jgi:hypothetical protein